MKYIRNTIKQACAREIREEGRRQQNVGQAVGFK